MVKENVSQTDEAKEVQPETEKTVEKEEKPESQAGTIPASSEEPTAIEKAQKILDSIDDGLKKSEAVAARMEKAAARMLLGGKAAAGEMSKTPEQTAQEKMDSDVLETISKFD